MRLIETQLKNLFEGVVAHTKEKKKSHTCDGSVRTGGLFWLRGGIYVTLVEVIFLFHCHP